MAFLDVHPVSPISTFLHTNFAHFHHIYSFSRLIDMVIHFQGDIILPTSFLRSTFSMDLSIGDRVFYTRSNGLRPPATVVGTVKTDSFTWNTTKMG